MKEREEECGVLGSCPAWQGEVTEGKMAEDGLGGDYNSGCHLLCA